jgi:hypothetical protein
MDARACAKEAISLMARRAKRFSPGEKRANAQWRRIYKRMLKKLEKAKADPATIDKFNRVHLALTPVFRAELGPIYDETFLIEERYRRRGVGAAALRDVAGDIVSPAIRIRGIAAEYVYGGKEGQDAWLSRSVEGGELDIAFRATVEPEEQQTVVIGNACFGYTESEARALEEALEKALVTHFDAAYDVSDVTLDVGSQDESCMFVVKIPEVHHDVEKLINYIYGLLTAYVRQQPVEVFSPHAIRLKGDTESWFYIDVPTPITSAKVQAERRALREKSAYWGERGDDTRVFQPVPQRKISWTNAKGLINGFAKRAGWSVQDDKAAWNAVWKKQQIRVCSNDDCEWVLQIADINRYRFEERKYPGPRWVVSVVAYKKTKAGKLRVDTKQRPFFVSSREAQMVLERTLSQDFDFWVPSFQSYILAADAAATFMDTHPGADRRPNPRSWVLPAAYALTSAVALGTSLYDLHLTFQARRRA